jgi:hypothetical protein
MAYHKREIGIYRIVSPNGKTYIGSSVSCSERWRDYKKLRCKAQQAIYNSLKKYGPDNHKFSVLINCEETNLVKMEQLYIDIYQPQLNICMTAGRPPDRTGQVSWNKGIPRSPELIKQHTEFLRGNQYRSKKVIQLNKSGKLIATFNSAKEAEDLTKANRNGISRVCRNKQATCGGFKWRYDGQS